MNKKAIALLLVGTMTTSTLTACSTQKTTGETEATETTEAVADSAAETESEDTSASEYPMTFDNYGREVTITQKPQKVLTLGPNCTELFAALGLGDYVIGRSLINHSRGPLPEYADVVDHIPELNYSSATREAILRRWKAMG